MTPTPAPARYGDHTAAVNSSIIFLPPDAAHPDAGPKPAATGPLQIALHSSSQIIVLLSACALAHPSIYDPGQRSYHECPGTT